MCCTLYRLSKQGNWAHHRTWTASCFLMPWQHLGQCTGIISGVSHVTRTSWSSYFQRFGTPPNSQSPLTSVSQRKLSAAPASSGWASDLQGSRHSPCCPIYESNWGCWEMLTVLVSLCYLSCIISPWSHVLPSYLHHVEPPLVLIHTMRNGFQSSCPVLRHLGHWGSPCQSQSQKCWKNQPSAISPIPVQRSVLLARPPPQLRVSPWRCGLSLGSNGQTIPVWGTQWPTKMAVLCETECWTVKKTTRMLL